MSEQEEKKKYQIIDKRGAADETPAAETAPPEPDTADEPEDEQPDPATQQHEGRGARIEDAMHFALNMLREHALDCLGMLPHRGAPKTPDAEKAKTAAGIYHEITKTFPALDAPPQDIPEEEERFRSDLGAVLIMALNIVQGQAMIGMGLLADPVTNLIARDMEQARRGVDFFSAIKQAATPHLPAEVSRQLETVVTDLRMNYVNQLKQQ